MAGGRSLWAESTEKFFTPLPWACLTAAATVERLVGNLTRRGLQVFAHEQVPSSDACIALGQAYIGTRRLLASDEPSTGR